MSNMQNIDLSLFCILFYIFYCIFCILLYIFYCIFRIFHCIFCILFAYSAYCLSYSVNNLEYFAYSLAYLAYYFAYSAYFLYIILHIMIWIRRNNPVAFVHWLCSLARDRHTPHQGVGRIRTAQSSRTTVLSPSAGRSILEALPPLFGPWFLIHAFQPTMRSLGARSSLCSSLISSRLMLQSSSVRSCNSSRREFPCLTLGNGRYQNKWSMKAWNPAPMRGTSLVVTPSFFNLKT